MARQKISKTDRDPRWTSKLPPAPGELRMVQAFLNTADLRRGTDLDGPRALTGWLVHWSLTPDGIELGDDDLRQALEVREALRTLVRAAPGSQASDRAAEHLDRALARAAPRIRFGRGGRARLESVSPGLDGALAALCAIVAKAQMEGAWERFKCCIETTCQAAFYDFSRSRSAKYCSANCGGRISSSTYRKRNLELCRRMERISAMTRRLG